MGINIGDKPEVNVVNIGDEFSSLAQVQALNSITTGQFQALAGALSPSSSNVLITNSALTTYGTNFALKAGQNTFTSWQFIDMPSSTTTAGLRVNAASGVTVSSIVGAFYVSVLNTATNGHAVVIENRGNGDCIRILDAGSDPVSSMFRVDNAGNVFLGGDLSLTTTAINTAVGAQTYPDEITIKVGTATYRVPARAI